VISEGLFAVSAASGLGVVEESVDIGARRLLFPSERGAPALIQLEYSMRETVHIGNSLWQRFFAIPAINERSTS
jgi:hypothetical protein